MKRTKRECYIGDDGYCHVPLAKGKGEAICDKNIINKVNEFSWCIDKIGYIYSMSKKTKKRIRISFHRMIFEYFNGTIPEKMEIDHINRIKIDNRIENLRLCTRSENLKNQSGRGKCKYKGVNKCKNGWSAHIRPNKNLKDISLGVFKTPELAAEMYDIFAYHYYKEFAFLNFPEEKEFYKKQKIENIKLETKQKTSKYYGVTEMKRRGKKSIFLARIVKNYKMISIGSSICEETAARMVDTYNIENNLGKKINFPEDLSKYKSGELKILSRKENRRLKLYKSSLNELNQEPKQMVLFKAS